MSTYTSLGEHTSAHMTLGANTSVHTSTHTSAHESLGAHAIYEFGRTYEHIYKFGSTYKRTYDFGSQYKRAYKYTYKFLSTYDRMYERLYVRFSPCTLPRVLSLSCLPFCLCLSAGDSGSPSCPSSSPALLHPLVPSEAPAGGDTQRPLYTYIHPTHRYRYTLHTGTDTPYTQVWVYCTQRCTYTVHRGIHSPTRYT